MTEIPVIPPRRTMPETLASVVTSADRQAQREADEAARVQFEADMEALRGVMADADGTLHATTQEQFREALGWSKERYAAVFARALAEGRFTRYTHVPAGTTFG